MNDKTETKQEICVIQHSDIGEFRKQLDRLANDGYRVISSCVNNNGQQFLYTATLIKEIPK